MRDEDVVHPGEDPTMDMIADVKCYHCGWISGRIAGKRGAPRHEWAFEARDGSSTPLSARRRLRCARCNGPVYAEDLRSREFAEPLVSPSAKQMAGAA
jgi:hypothetical protein